MALTDTAGGPAPGRPERPRRPWVLPLRLVVSAALVAWILSRVHLGTVLPKHHSLTALAWFAAAAVIAAVGIALGAWRWQRVLAAFDAPVPLRTLASAYFAGQFVGNTLPSTIGGDVLRVTRLAKQTGSETAFGSVVLERLTGFVALPLISFVGFALHPSLLDGDHAWVAIAISVGTLGALVVLLVIAGSPRLAGRFAGHDSWMRYIGAIHVGVDRMRHHPPHAWSVLLSTFVYQASNVLMMWLCVKTLGVSIPAAAVVAFGPAVLMAQVVPVSVGGFGVREGMLVLLLGPLGVPTGKAFGIGVAWYCAMLLASLLGAPTFAIGHRQPATTRADPASPSSERS